MPRVTAGVSILSVLTLTLGACGNSSTGSSTTGAQPVLGGTVTAR